MTDQDDVTSTTKTTISTTIGSSKAGDNDRVRNFRGCLALCFDPHSPLLATLENMLEKQSAAVASRTFERVATHQWHITLATKAELRTLSKPAVDAAMALPPGRVFPIGLGGSASHGVYFIVCVWPRAQAFRRQYGLPSKGFHVSVSVHNRHDIDKTATALLDLESASPSWMHALSMDALEALARQLLLEGARQQALALRVATHLCATHGAQTTRGWERLGDTALQAHRYKLAMLSYAQAYMLISRLPMRKKSGNDDPGLVQDRCITRMVTCSAFTEWGHVFREHEMAEIPRALYSFLLQQQWPRHLCHNVRACAMATGRSCLPRERLWTVLRTPPHAATAVDGDGAFYRLPRFFCWLVPFQLAVMSTPRNELDIVHLVQSVGIRHIVTLTQEKPLPSAWFPPLPRTIRNTLLPVANYDAPTLAQIDLFIKSCCSWCNQANGDDDDRDDHDDDAALPVLVHCGGGKGRAGVMAACYLVAFGFLPPPRNAGEWPQPAMAADDAIAALRAVRPGSIETPQQEAAVRAYSSRLWKRFSVLPRPVDEPLASAPIVTGAPLARTDLLVLCGLPGSGKSTFRRMLVKRSAVAAAGASKAQQLRSNAPWLELSGDEHGRDGCERSLGQRGVQRAILDRVNGKCADRRAFLQLAATWSQHATAVWFDFAADLCVYRAQQRPDHATLAPGRRVVTAVAQHAREFTAPTLAEGFASVVRVTSLEAARALAQMLAPPIGLLRFPRTPHVLDLGAATADDVVMDKDAVSGSPRPSTTCGATALSGESDSSGEVVVLTEKVDGANLGISLAADGRTFVVQNRSHYVTAASHSQFRQLDAFLDVHKAVLRAILHQDPLVPERFVLYGEWLAATHSIAYSSLRSLFYAFDLYDRETQRFWDRQSLEALLLVTTGPRSSSSSFYNGVGTGERVEIVPKLWSGPRLPSSDALIKMVTETRSQFYDGVIEGLYVKWETPDAGVRHRGKVVRGDFIAGNDHWTKGVIQFNTVVSPGLPFE